MGLDIYYYDKKKEEHFLAEISEGLHIQIFYGNIHPGEWGILSKIKEYYGADSVVTLNRSQIDELIKKLLSIKEFIPDKYKNEIDELVIILRNKEFDNITIAGD
ncbi:hypothetical protein CN692_21790 [Bacillus sp. AFS002410]|uniref:hypothetical protein n=1 Tax=Bacillus sp. AFS002410 TaxID=2033481 RepID=UPI000BF0D46C|nr:hypothetical protein [Bacillus sp. AFS002410]PEJ52348.1 hypothetical protein CN692_21790 [Bacillus sp. AFS002410]